MLAAVLATLAWVPQSVQNVSAIYCYPGDPPAVYQACVAYNQGIGQQVNNQNQLNSIQHQIKDTVAQITQTQLAIDDLSRKIRFGEAAIIQLQARVTVRDQLLNQRLRYIDSHGSVNYLQLVLTSNSMNQLMNRLVGAQAVTQSDHRLLSDLQEAHVQIAVANAGLDQQRTQVSILLQQQKTTEAELEKNLATEAAAL